MALASVLALGPLLTGCAGDSDGRPDDGESADAGDGDGDGADTGDGDGDGEASCEQPAVGEAVLRRMTRLEYDNTIYDLLGDESRLGEGFVPEEEAHGFNNNAELLTVGELLAEQYMAAAEQLAINAVADLDGLLPCDPGMVGEDVCAEQFIREFGKRAYRRPLDDEQASRLMDVFIWGRAEESFAFGIQLVLEVILQSPSFLYRVELGTPSGTEGIVALDDYELASRLSYLLWNSMPDDELLAVADAGMLSDSAQLRAQAERMLEDPRAHSVVQDFYVQFLDLDMLETSAKDPETYPDYTEEIRDLMMEETQKFISHVIFEDDGKWATLLTADYAFLNSQLGWYYGVPDVPPGEIARFDLPEGSQRGGLLTQGALMSVLGKYEMSSPVHRGRFVRERVMCQVMPPPPDVEFEPPQVDPNSTTPQKFEEHSSNPACAACHQLMDPIGFGFEHYDGVGRWRSTENGFPVDATGKIVEGGDASGEFYGVGEASELLAHSEDVGNCVVRQWFRYAYGREKTEYDECTEDWLRERFVEHGSVRELLLDLTQTDAFRYARAEGGE